MYGELHLLVGIALQKAGPIEWAIPASILSHFSLDSLNWGPDALYHGLGEGWRRALTIACRVCIWLVILAFLWTDPKYLICGLIAWLCFDIEWVIGFLLGRHGLGWHERMFPKFLKTQWALVVNVLVAIVMLLLVR